MEELDSKTCANVDTLANISSKFNRSIIAYTNLNFNVLYYNELGAPQGYILASIIFLIFINDLKRETYSKITKLVTYADDVCRLIRLDEVMWAGFRNL